MRIALLSYEYPPETGFGGIGTYTYYHAHALRRLGHDVHVFAGTTRPERRTIDDDGVTVTRFRKVGPTERLVRSAGDLQLWWFQNRLQTATNMFGAVRRELRAGAFDVVEMPECGGDGAFVSQFLDLPTVVRLHSPAELIMPTYDTSALDRVLTSAVERLGLVGARAISSCSHWLAREVRERMAVDRPIEVIPNGIDLRQFDADEGIDVHERFGIPRDRVIVFFANRLEPRKGIHVVRDVLVPILQRHDDAVFVLAGADDGVVDRELRPLLAEHDLADRLFTLGRIAPREVRACLKQADVFLLPSIWENAPYSLLEAMSAGKAIVASDCGGVPEILRHEVDGLVARTGDADAFRRALDRLLKSPALRLRLGSAARQRVEARYTDEVVARRTLAFYEWALGAPATTAPRSAPRQRPVGPEDWFQVWWLHQDAAGETPVLRPLPDGRPALADCSLAELAFAHKVLSRSYWDGAGRADTPEARFLDELSAVHRDRALDARRQGAEPAATARLALPTTSHPLFASSVAAGSFLAELWRLGDAPHVVEWLARETGSPRFVEMAKLRLPLRRLAVHAARIAPGAASYEVLRRIYRSVGDTPRIVEQDREFIDRGPAGAEFGRAVDELGLHAPMRRPNVFGKRRRRTAGGSATAADITVLIPSYRHEAFVADAIRSALEQTETPARVLVIDDRSPDGTVAAARAVGDPRIDVRVNERNLGLGPSIDQVLDHIETPFVALLNSDDLFHPDRVGRCLAALRDTAGARLVATGFATMDERGHLLDATNVCAVESGPQVAGWLRWYAGVRDELPEPADRTRVAALLRHNHLATSSNIVCETAFLREQRDALAGLRYCLDWMLFLRAAVAGELAYVDEPLLGYRLHASNTVWFDDATRADYVHEVNHVLAVVLRDVAARRRAAGASATEVFEELCALLRDGVARHGETDGFEMLVADVLGQRPPDPAPSDAPSPSTLLARDALARKARDRDLADLTLPPWRLAELARRREQATIAEHLATSLTGAEPRLRRRLTELEARVAQLSEHEADVAALQRAFQAERSAWERDRAELERRLGEAAAAHESALRDANAEHERRLQAAVAELTAEVDRHRDAGVRLEARLQEAIAQRDTVALELHRTRDELAVTRRDASAELATARERSATLWATRQRLEVELHDARARGDAAERLQRIEHGALRDLFDEYQGAVGGLTATPAWGLGRALTAGLRLGGPVKTLRRAAARTATAVGRRVARCGRWFAGADRPVVAVLGDDHVARLTRDERGAELAALCATAGVRTHLLSWHRAAPAALAAPEVRLRRLRADAALFAADLRRATRAHGPALAELRVELGGDRDLGPACSATATIAALGATRVLATGDTGALLHAVVAAELTGAALVVALERRDLRAERCDPRVVAAAVRRAAAVAVDDDRTAARLADLVDAAPRELVVLVPAPAGPLHGAASPAAGSRRVVACVGPELGPASALAIADGVAAAVAAGADLELSVLAPPGADALDWAGLACLARAAAAAPVLAQRLRVTRRASARDRHDLLARADVLLEVDGVSSPVSARGHALARGIPVVALDPATPDLGAALATLGAGGGEPALAPAEVAARSRAALLRLLGIEPPAPPVADRA